MSGLSTWNTGRPLGNPTPESLARRELRWRLRGSCVTPLGHLVNHLIYRTNGCIEWDGNHDPRGYSRVKWYGTQVRVHRLMWELLRGPISPEHEIDHLCRNQGCVNTDHLEPVTHRVNVQRAYDSPTCLRGHARTEENTNRDQLGRNKGCRPCELERGRQRRLRAA